MITVVLDDDPTGTQAVSDVSVVLDWSDDAVWDAVLAGDRAVHVLTNSRAHDGAEAAALVASAARSALAQYPDSRVILRGDSTLRAHLWEEYEALRSVVAPGRENVPLLLVPALPAAGRTTIGGVHYLERDGRRVRLDETEYAGDGELSYSSSRLSEWADERSGGRFASADAVTVPLDHIRRPSGAEDVASAIVQAARRRAPAVVVPDAETNADLRTIAIGLRVAEEHGLAAIVRCAPAFAAVLTGTGATKRVPAPSAGDGMIVVCGSFVAGSTAQLDELERRRPGSRITARVAELAGEGWEAEVERVSAEARDRVAAGRLAVVATERVRDPELAGADAQRRVASSLARVARQVDTGVVIAKGGITSAVTAREGRGARSARVIGPVLTGVALWKLPDDTDYLVVPGNVGGAGLLADLVEAVAC